MCISQIWHLFNNVTMCITQNKTEIAQALVIKIQTENAPY